LESSKFSSIFSTKYHKIAKKLTTLFLSILICKKKKNITKHYKINKKCI
jgi:hypothetical protein